MLEFSNPKVCESIADSLNINKTALSTLGKFPQSREISGL